MENGSNNLCKENCLRWHWQMPICGSKTSTCLHSRITYWRSSNVHDCWPMNFPSWGVPLLFLERWNPASLQRLVAAKTAFSQDLEGKTKSTHKKIKTPRFSEAQMSIFLDKLGDDDVIISVRFGCSRLTQKSQGWGYFPNAQEKNQIWYSRSQQTSIQQQQVELPNRFAWIRAANDVSE